MAWRILKISKVSQRKDFGIHPKNIFVFRRISGWPEKTGQILNCRFLGPWLWYEYDFFTIRLQIFCEIFFEVKFCNMTPKRSNLKNDPHGVILHVIWKEILWRFRKYKNYFFWCNMTPLSTKLGFKALRSVFTGL